MIHHKTCPICSGREISGFLNCPDHFLTKEVFNIDRCAECGFLFTQDNPEESQAGRYYESEDYISHNDSKEGTTDKAYQFVRRIMLSRKKRIVERVSGLSSGNILDIGSGTGHFLNTMKSAGWYITGVEISAKTRDYALSKFGIQTIAPDELGSLNPGSFDCISLWHVLEHFNDPDKYMEEIRHLLKPDGVVIIALPNSGSFDSKYYNSFWAAFDVPRHLWHFNPSTFSIFAKKSKFKIIARRYLPFDVFYISILSEKYKGSFSPLLSGAIKGLWFSLRSMLSKSGSSSVIYILRKEDS